MEIIKSVVEFIPNVMKRSMYAGHKLGDVVLPRLLQKVGAPPVVSELAALPVTAVGAGAALWVGGSNVITPFFGVLVSGIFNPVGLTIFVPMLVLFGAVTCLGIGMGDAVLKKFGKTPIFDGVYDNQAFRIERKAKLADKATKAKAAAELEQQKALDAQSKAPAAAASPPRGTVPFAGFEPGSETPEQIAGVRNANAAASFNGSSERGVPKFAGFPPAGQEAQPDTQQGPRERPPRPDKT